METIDPQTEQNGEEYSSNEDYVRACADANAALNEMDSLLMRQDYSERAKALQEKIFCIIEHCINEIYECTVLLKNETGETE